MQAVTKLRIELQGAEQTKPQDASEVYSMTG
jgi:hypothetical protein